MKLLVVGGSEELLETILLILKVRWQELNLFHVTEATEATELIHREQPDIVLLHLPERSEGSAPVACFDLISQIRSFSDVPLIVLSQSYDVVDKIRALEMGADDWLTPSSIPMEFIAKVRAILRRCIHQNNDRVYSFLDGKLSVNCATHEVLVSGSRVKLTPIEHRILCQLVRNEGRIVSRVDLLHRIWGPNYEDDTEILKISIYRLRSKIEQNPSNPEIILTERGVGYIIRASDLS